MFDNLLAALGGLVKVAAAAEFGTLAGIVNLIITLCVLAAVFNLTPLAWGSRLLAVTALHCLGVKGHKKIDVFPPREAKHVLYVLLAFAGSIVIVGMTLFMVDERSAPTERRLLWPGQAWISRSQ